MGWLGLEPSKHGPWAVRNPFNWTNVRKASRIKYVCGVPQNDSPIVWDGLLNIETNKGPAQPSRTFFGSFAISCSDAAAGSDAAGSAGGAGTAAAAVAAMAVAARAELRGSWQAEVFKLKKGGSIHREMEVLTYPGLSTRIGRL